MRAEGKPSRIDGCLVFVTDKKERLDEVNRLTKRFGGNQANDRFGKVPSMKKGCFIDGLLS